MMDGSFDLKRLRYFVCVAEDKSFSRAASRLRIAQPALSRQVHELERELGVEVFTRHARGVNLTEAGEVLLNRAYTIFRQVEQTRDDVAINAKTPRGTVTVGAPPTAGEFIIPELVKRAQLAYPDIRLRIIEGFSGDLHRKLMNHEISLAVVHNPATHPEIKITHLLTEHLCLVGPKGSLAKPTYSLKEAVALPLVLPDRPNYLRILINEYAERFGLSINDHIRSDGVWITKSLVRAKLGFTILTYGAVFSEVSGGLLDAVPIERPKIEWPLGVAMRVDQSRKRTLVVVEQLIKSVAEDLLRVGVWK